MAWTITPTIDSIKAIKHEVYGDKIVVLKLACTSDATEGSITLRTKRGGGTNGTTYADKMEQICGSTLYLCVAEPGSGAAEPSGTFTATVSDKNSISILTTGANSVDATTYTVGSTTVGLYPPVFEEITVAIDTLGDENTADIYLTFWK